MSEEEGLIECGVGDKKASMNEDLPLRPSHLYSNPGPY
jgi:hypothetical protein